ncbi:uncharacterized protein LOC123680276 [Harmonia axyridis]|uniref:uncharacterized protein LOC123680276 n=1 Tax=Harmonia axyridis TaxID=115357 RepID=UPI001E277D0E|nr:uncharacterized protein LOC123680276 [Harmonia axyridis]
MHALSSVVFLVVVAVASASVLGPAVLNGGATLIGPSGAVVRSGLIGAPLGLASPLGLGLAGPLGLGLAAPLGVRVTATNLRVAPAGSPVGVLVPAGNGLEGQWVPDISERLHDDGSYKPEIYGA